MKDRAMGIENELGVMFKDEFGNFSSPENDVLSIAQIPKDNFPSKGGMFGGSFWLPNGGRVYIDMGHPEYASPECLRLRDLVAVSRAGERICAGMFLFPTKDKKYRQLFKNNLGVGPEGTEGKTFGCHENYLIHGYKPDDAIMHRHLIPFLITRQILEGSGWWTREGKFSFSQRAMVLENIASVQTVSGRPIINLRDEPHISDREGMSRLHLILGDANMLDWSLYLKFGTTSLVLAMLEEGHIFKDDCQNAVAALHDVAFDGTARKRLVKLERHGTLSALEVQEFYLEKAKKYISITDFMSPESRMEAYETVRMWEEALKAIRNRDTGWMLGRLDWATKLHIGNTEAAKLGPGDPKAIMDMKKRVDILYHAITDTRLRDRIYSKWGERQLVSEQEIDHMVENPPADTRARPRGLFVALCAAKQLGQEQNIFVDWSKVRYKNREISLGHPLDKDNPKLEGLMRKLLQNFNTL